MKVSRNYYGKLVKLTWRGDPIKARVDRKNRPMGRAGLAMWVEYGVVDTVVDGVVHLIHSEAYSPGQSEWDELEETRVPEDLVESIVIYEPTKGVVDALHIAGQAHTA